NTADDQAITINSTQHQSQIATGSGGMFGLGLFKGMQTNLSYVPAQTTDFIFTAIGEQLGFVGGAIVIGLFGILIWRMLLVAALARDRFSQLRAAGPPAVFALPVL